MVLFKKGLALIFALLSIFSVVAAEKVSFTVDAPMVVSVDGAFRVVFELNAKPDSDSFVQPKFDEAFEVVAGPSVSQGSSVQIINGEMTKSVSYAITYILLPQKAGTFSIGSAVIGVGGKSYSTKPTAVEVRDGGQSSSASSQQQQQRQSESRESAADNTIEKDDLMLRLELSSRSVYKGQAVRAILKLYNRVRLADYGLTKKPAFNGFWSQEVDIERGPYRETLNNKVYEAYNIAEFLLFPQKDGTIVIDPAEVTVVVHVVMQSNQAQNPFFGGGFETIPVKKVLTTPKTKIEVKPLPAGAPASFAGAVGRYTLSSKLSSTEVVANSAITLQLTVSGTGNLKFISAPKLSLPESFDLYEVKSEESIQNKASGSVGYRRFDYTIIVRAEGIYDIKPVEFSYFDVDKGEYVTLLTDPMKINVLPDGSEASALPQVTLPGVKREDVRLLGEDIRFIKLGKPNLLVTAMPLALSSTYWIVVLSILVIGVVAYYVIRKRIQDNRNVVLVKGRRASKVAIKRFRIAEKYMREQDRRAFYEEMLRALWGYLGDKFNIPVADLTRDLVRAELSRRGASTEAEQVIAVIARCEEAQYSPAATTEMNSLYEEGVDVISKIEKIAK